MPAKKQMPIQKKDSNILRGFLQLEMLRPERRIRDGLYYISQLHSFFKRRVLEAEAPAPPEALTQAVKPKADYTKIRLIDYDAHHIEEKEVKDIRECFPYKDKASLTWIRIDGLADLKTISELANYYGLHSLVVEDIVNPDQRPKQEDYENYIYIVLKIPHYYDDRNEIDVEQVSIILGKRFVISIQEKESDVFNAVIEKLRSRKGLLMRKSSDYLAYRLIDIIVDRYFIVLEKISDDMVHLESEVLKASTASTVQVINKLKHEAIIIRKAVWPIREVINGLEKAEISLMGAPTKLYLRDVRDHVVQIIDDVGTLHEILSGLLEIYHSSITSKTNEIVKVLTIMSSIFIPLTFVASLYGMNLQLPGHDWGYSFFILLAGMLFASLLMLIYFRRKKWV